MQQRTQTDYQQEYLFAITEAKKLAAELEGLAPDYIRERRDKAIRYASDVLIMMGVPKHKVAGKLLEDFEGAYSRATIYRVLGVEYAETEESSQHETKQVHYILPENEEYDKLLARQIAVLQMARSKMSQPFVSLMDKKEYNHTIATGNGLCQMAENSFDERQLTHVPLINLFIQLAQEFTAGDAYSHYYTTAKDIIKKMTADSKIRGIRTMEAMSGKQAHETVHLKIKEIHYSLEPTDEHEARAKGFSGERCPKCRKWRTDRETDATNTGRFYYCIHCEHKFERQPIPAYQKPNAVSLDFSGNTLKVNRLSSGGVTHG